MSELADLQRAFQAAIMGSNPTPGLFVNEQVNDEQAGSTVPTVAHFDIYINAYPARLAAALKDNYPVLHRVLGDDAFHALAMAYIDAHPSHFRSIRWFGDGLHAFVEADPDLLSHPALADLTRMDWALRGAFDAANALTLQSSDLEALTPEEWPLQRFKLHPSVALLDLQWAVEPVWRALNEDENAETEMPDVLSHTLLIWRRDLECLWRSLGRHETAALRALQEGAPFAEICDAVAENVDGAPAQTAASLLRQWLADGLLTP